MSTSSGSLRGAQLICRRAADESELRRQIGAVVDGVVAAVVGLYAIIARSFPTAVRAGGTGLVIGVGRGGAAASPIVAGLLFGRGHALPTVALLLGAGSTVGALALIALRDRGRS